MFHLGQFRIVLLAALAFLLITPAHADTYKIVYEGYSQHEDFYGIDIIGDYVVDLSYDASFGLIPQCDPHAAGCYASYYVGSTGPTYTYTPPALDYDDGSPCTSILFPGFLPDKGVCNNGHTVVGGMIGPFGSFNVWDGPDPIADLLLPYATFDGGYMDSYGDVVFIDGHDDKLIAAYDLTSTRPAPEPNTLILLGTGCLSLLGATRRLTRR